MDVDLHVSVAAELCRDNMPPMRKLYHLRKGSEGGFILKKSINLETLKKINVVLYCGKKMGSRIISLLSVRSTWLNQKDNLHLFSQGLCVNIYEPHVCHF